MKLSKKWLLVTTLVTAAVTAGVKYGPAIKDKAQKAIKNRAAISGAKRWWSSSKKAYDRLQAGETAQAVRLGRVALHAYSGQVADGVMFSAAPQEVAIAMAEDEAQLGSPFK